MILIDTTEKDMDLDTEVEISRDPTNSIKDDPAAPEIFLEEKKDLCHIPEEEEVHLTSALTETMLNPTLSSTKTIGNPFQLLNFQ